MKRKYWNGSLRLISDLFWCFSISILYHLFNHITITISELTGFAIGEFFIFFFWSWNKEHMKSSFARIGIHCLMSIFLLASLLGVVSILNDTRISFSSLILAIVVFPVFVFLAIIKYIKLLKNKEKDLAVSRKVIE